MYKRDAYTYVSSHHFVEGCSFMDWHRLPKYVFFPGHLFAGSNTIDHCVKGSMHFSYGLYLFSCSLSATLAAIPSKSRCVPIRQQ